MKKQAKKLLRLRRKVQYLKRELGILSETNGRLARCLQVAVLKPGVVPENVGMSTQEFEEWKAALAPAPAVLVRLKEFVEPERVDCSHENPSGGA